MKKLSLLFSLFSLVANAQIRLNLTVAHAYTGEALEETALIQKGDCLSPDFYEYQHNSPSVVYKNISIAQLRDSFLFSHIGYADSKGLLTQYSYKIHGDQIDLHVSLEPVVRTFFSELHLAKSRKIKNDSVLLQAYFKGSPELSLVYLYDRNGKKICTLDGSSNQTAAPYLYTKKLPMDALKDGYFKTNIGGQPSAKDTFSFLKADWAKVHYLQQQAPQKPHSDSEMKLLIRYFDALKEQEGAISTLLKQYYDLENSMERRIHNTEQRIDSLKSAILVLKNPLLVLPAKRPKLFEEAAYPVAEEAVIFIREHRTAKPLDEDFPAFLTRIGQELSTSLKCPYSGSISLRVRIFRNGQALCSRLHCSPKAENICEALIEKIEKSQWISAIQRGKLFEEDIIIHFRLCKL